MPSPGVTRASTAGGQKTLYNPDLIIETMNRSTPTWSLIKSEGKQLATDEGLGFVETMQLAASHAGKMMAENDDLPVGNALSDAQSTFNFKLHVEIVSGTVRSLIAGGQVGGDSISRRHVREAVACFTERMGKMLFMPSTGLITSHSSSAATSATVIRVASPRLLDIQMPVDVLVTATGAVGDGVVGARILDVNSVTGSTDYTVTLDTAVGAFASLDATYGLFISGSWHRHAYGLPDILSDTGVLGTLDRSLAANQRFRAQVKDMGGAEPTPELLDLAVRSVRRRSPGSAHNDHIAIVNETMMNFFINNGAQRLEFRGSDDPYQLFARGVKIGDLTFLEDRHMIDNEIWIIRPADLCCKYPKSVSRTFWWPGMNKSAGNLLAQHPMYPKLANYTVLCGFYEIVPERCNSMFRLHNFNIPGPSIAWTI